MDQPENEGSPAVIARLGVDEHEAAAALGLSVHTLRKDRRTTRKFPYFKVGERVLYSIDRLREALAKLEVGVTPANRRRRAQTKRADR